MPASLLSRLTPLLLLSSLLLHPTTRASNTNSLHKILSRLYSSHFELSTKGIPEVTIGLMDRQTQVTFSCPLGGTALLYHKHKKPTRIPLDAGERFKIRLLKRQPAHVRYWLTAFRVHHQAQRQWRQLARIWAKRNIALVSRTIGTTFAINGRLLDNRMRLAVLGFYSDKQTAQREATRLFTLYKAPIRIHEQLTRLPHNTFRLSNQHQHWLVDSVLKILPHQGKIRIEQVEHGRGYRWHGFKTRQYFGKIFIAPDRSGSISVINRLPLPELLRGLLPAEMPASAPLEALKAQSICARNEIMAKIGSRHHADPYLFCANTHCQVYAGANSSRARSDRAIQQTRGQVLMLGKRRLADTPYSAVCGGHTEHNENVWYTPPNPSLRGKPDLTSSSRVQLTEKRQLKRWLQKPPTAYCATRKTRRRARFRWQRRLSAGQMNRRVNARHQVGAVLSLKVLHRGVSGRAHAIKIIGSRKEIHVHGELRIRKLFGGLNSSMFLIKRLPPKGNIRAWMFVGGGWGHGVGLCQYGAIGRARAGQSYQQIIQHYFSNTRIKRLY